ncbi:ATP-binding protein [Actinomadura viridis]|uniref:ATPase/DNA-binding CsgD family transcriptional regulator n=1 Tax=Actinomadura viridis TaxID=58110 RepID=A0A931DU89_9ACTN|nr:LuxR C-terminal-related transcriptional regulator [Actinomadura viridis]MBG6093991.1 putative ATPase/DNA-binding CsgD family transcriptional regulator [Actinomadura viridis]
MLPRKGARVAERISEREAEVLAALGARLSNAQIASRLHISVRTVESHVSSLLRKYGMSDRWALAELARSAEGEPGRVAGLPVSETTFVGRTAERAAVLAAVEQARLVTLLGPGGVGKTRLAVVAAEEAVALFPSGGAFVDLVPVRDGFVARAVATTLGVTEGSHQPLEEAVAARLGTGRSLLVLDNCEHVIDEAAGFAERILAACPGTRVLVTSRERLGVPGERSVPIAPLPLGSDAERLFLDRALAADPRFVAEPAVVAELCARLDGMPLAIELAAARGASLGPTGLLAALDDALRLLSGVRGGDARHRSLRAVLSWSHDLLDEEEQALFRRLGVFVGAFDMDAASAVGGDRAGVADLLGRLVDKSLVVHVRGRVSRWRLLETVRAFALAQMTAAGDEDKTRTRHLRWAAGAASAIEGRIGDPTWREDFDAMAADLRAALAAAGGPGEVTHRLASALAHLTFARRHLLESFAHHRTAAALATSAASAARDLRAGAGCAHVSTTSNQHVFELLLEAAEQAGRARDDRGRAIDLARAVETACRFPEAFETGVPYERLRGLLDEAAAAGPGGDPEVTAALALARAWLAGPDKGAPDPALASAALAATRATADPVLVSAGLCAAGTAALHAGRLREANRITRERLALLPSMDRDDPYCAPEICNTYGRACLYAIMTGDLPGAMAAARAGIDDDLLRDTHITASRLVQPLVLTGRFHEAIGHAERMLDQWERAGRPAPLWMLPAVSMTVLAGAMLDEPGPVALWRAHAEEMAGGTLGTAPVAAFVDARLALHDERYDTAEPLVRTAFSVDAPLDKYLAYARAAGAELAVAARLPDAADLLAAATPLAEENAWAAACLARARGRLHDDRAELARALTAFESLDALAERDHTQALLARL